MATFLKVPLVPRDFAKQLTWQQFYSPVFYLTILYTLEVLYTIKAIICYLGHTKSFKLLVGVLPKKYFFVEFMEWFYNLFVCPM